MRVTVTVTTGPGHVWSPPTLPASRGALYLPPTNEQIAAGQGGLGQGRRGGPARARTSGASCVTLTRQKRATGLEVWRASCRGPGGTSAVRRRAAPPGELLCLGLLRRGLLDGGDPATHRR